MNETNKYIKRGYFWLPEDSNNRQPGTLTINYGGNIELDLMGSLGGKFRRFTQMDETSEYFDVNGLIEDDGEVVLKECFITNSKFTTKHNFETHKLLANIALIGDESLQSDSYQLFKFTVDNLNVWMGKSGIKTEFMNSDSNAIISYVCPKNVSIKILTDFKLELLYQPSYSMSFTNTEDNFIKENIYLVLTSNNSKPIEEFRLLASRIVNFFSFSMDLFLYIDDINILSDINFKDNLTFKNTKVYYNNYPSVMEKQHNHVHDMIFSFNDISENFESIINNWLSAYDLIEPTMNLYFSTQKEGTVYLESKFLSLAQALETYSRRRSSETNMNENIFKELLNTLLESCPEDNKEWLKGRLMHGNEISLRKRLIRIIEPFKKYYGNSSERKLLINKILNTRNYLTHYSSDLVSITATEEEIFVLCYKMEALIQLILLEILGFTNEQISLLINKNLTIKSKLELKL